MYSGEAKKIPFLTEETRPINAYSHNRCQKRGRNVLDTCGKLHNLCGNSSETNTPRLDVCIYTVLKCLYPETLTRNRTRFLRREYDCPPFVSHPESKADILSDTTFGREKKNRVLYRGYWTAAYARAVFVRIKRTFYCPQTVNHSRFVACRSIATR